MRLVDRRGFELSFAFSVPIFRLVACLTRVSLSRSSCGSGRDRCCGPLSGRREYPPVESSGIAALWKVCSFPAVVLFSIKSTDELIQFSRQLTVTTSVFLRRGSCGIFHLGVLRRLDNFILHNSVSFKSDVISCRLSCSRSLQYYKVD